MKKGPNSGSKLVITQELLEQHLELRRQQTELNEAIRKLENCLLVLSDAGATIEPGRLVLAEGIKEPRPPFWGELRDQLGPERTRELRESLDLDEEIVVWAEMPSEFPFDEDRMS